MGKAQHKDPVKCEHCGAEIIFVRTSGGKYMPCESVPVWVYQTDDGPERMLGPGGAMIRASFTAPGKADDRRLIGYRPHWPSCHEWAREHAEPLPEWARDAEKAKPSEAYWGQESLFCAGAEGSCEEGEAI